MFDVSTTVTVIIILPLIASSVGYFRFIYFISIGYGLSILFLGVSFLIMFYDSLEFITIINSILLVAYGIRLGGYLFIREFFMKTYKDFINEVHSKKYPLIAYISVWISTSLLYTSMAIPSYFLLLHKNIKIFPTYVGTIIAFLGLILETAADRQKSNAKKINPKRFVDTGLYTIVRCPNYLGEVIFWTGIFISGFGNYETKLQFIIALFGWVSIVYIMFGGARRLEIRQNKNYGKDPEYQKYVKTTPILLPLVPLYSVEKYKWLVG